MAVHLVGIINNLTSVSAFKTYSIFKMQLCFVAPAVV